MEHFKVYRTNGTEVVAGDEITSFRDEKWIFASCTHPTKIHVKWKDDPNGQDFWPNTHNREFYPSVFDLRIDDHPTQIGTKEDKCTSM